LDLIYVIVQQNGSSSAARRIPCPFRKSYPHICMMQSAEDWDGSDAADALICSLQR
jgi:hypothetical protein